MSIKGDAKYLTLSYTFHHYEQLIAEAEETGMTIREFLENMLSKEAEQKRRTEFNNVCGRRIFIIENI